MSDKAEKAKVEDGKLSDFTPQQDNANAHTERGLQALGQAYDDVGYVAPMTAAANGDVLDGSARHEKAQDKFPDEALVIRHDGSRPIVMVREDVPDADDPLAKRISYGANRIAELDLNWTPEQMAADIEAGVDFGGLFDEAELEALGAIEAVPPAPSDPPVDRAAELQAEWGVEVGQVWALGEHRVACGDCTDRGVVEGVMSGERAYCLIADPPYGIDWNTNYTRFTTEYGGKKINHPPVINDDKPFDPRPWLEYQKVILWGANWYCQHIPLGSWFVWDKRHDSGAAFLSDAEIAWSKGKKGVYIYSETVQGAHRKEKAMHPTQKPVGLMVWCIQKSNAKKDDIILDPFLGSGTTLIAAHNLNRRCYGIEIDPGYVAVTLQRFQDHTDLTPELIP